MAEALYPGMSSAEVITQLDYLYVGLTALTLLHAFSKRGPVSGAMVVAYFCFHTAVFEHTSLFLGGTHCHASSPNLPMVSPCSSINSVLFYVPWTYTSIESARRLDLHPIAFPFVVGLLQIGFGAVYEMQGPWNSFWMWPDEDGVIANSPILKDWDGYPPLSFLDGAKQDHELATIANGVFKVSAHAGSALAERAFKFPIFAPYFHFAFGFAWAAGLLVTGRVSSSEPPSVFRLFVAGVLSMALFLPPIWVTRAASEAAEVSLGVGVPVSLALSLLPVVFFGRVKGGGAKEPDLLLLLISLCMQAFFVSWTWRYPTPPGLKMLVLVTATLHTVSQLYCCCAVLTTKAKAKRKKA
ncbi:hypothetical protein TrLO_g9921 [Triparma laevis f. longispina]|uniref:Uncharacterized protein n=1 Tax=Triparma laevis f. longispina TaxID=1714387 RepID=A0A9W7A261_9STRA|nr:hypothetical protein TrLO_g9921 [Triparma laevis f. longispina]